jgi:ketosteroid isomerase-like protein
MLCKRDLRRRDCRDMTDTDQVLAANLAFYRAFTERDVEAMDRLWARRRPVACTHPGWSVLRERDAIMASWRNILANPDAPRVACHDEEVLLYGDMAIVICEEELPGNALAASNVFVKEDGEWRLAHHHSGPIFSRQPEPRRVPKERLN